MHPESAPYYPPSLDKKPPAPTLVGQEALKFAELQQSLLDGVGNADNSFVTEEREYKKMTAEISRQLKELERDRESHGAEAEYHERIKECQNKIAELKVFIDKKLSPKYGYDRRSRAERNKKEKMYAFTPNDRGIVLKGETLSLIHLNLADVPVVRHNLASDDILYGKEGEGVKITIMPLNQKLDILVSVGKNVYSSHTIEPTPEAFREVFDNLFNLVQDDEYSDFANGPSPSPVEPAPQSADAAKSTVEFRNGILYSSEEDSKESSGVVEKPNVLNRFMRRLKRPLLAFGITGALLAVPENKQHSEENPAVVAVQKNNDALNALREKDLKEALGMPIAPNELLRLAESSLVSDKDLQKHDRRGKPKYDRSVIEAEIRGALKQLQQGHDAVIHGTIVLTHDAVAKLLEGGQTDESALNKKRYTKIIKPLLKAAKKRPSTQRHHS